MRIALIVLAVIVALVAAVLLVGWALPVKHEASREATYATSHEALFETITRPEEFPNSRTGIERVEVLPPVQGKRSYREVGGDGTLTYVVDEESPPRRLVTRIVDKDLPFGGSWTFELTPSGTGTTLRITENGEVYNPMYRFVSRFVMGHDATIERYLEDLQREVTRSSGE